MLFHTTVVDTTQFLLRRFLEFRWVSKLIMDGAKILSMSVENFYFLDSLNFMPMSLKNMPKSFDLNVRRVITLIF